MGHRKRVKHYDEPGHCHELTFSCYRRIPLLTNNRWREMLSHSIDQAIQRHSYSLFAMVYMPEHVHLLVRNLTEASTIEAAIDYIHRNPVRRGLCQRAVDWRWSSARFYYENRQDSGLPSSERVSADLLNMPP